MDLADKDLDHLPKVAYDVHPQKRIAEMLADAGLPTHGDKNALARRHARWLVLYNANVDRDPKQRHTLEQLRQELRAEEVEGKTRKETVEDVVAYQVRPTFFGGWFAMGAADVVGSQRANKAAFAKLTEAARPRKAVKVKAEESTPVLDGDATGDPEPAEDRSSTPGHEVIDVDGSES